ncbi:hypothetical protein [Nocardioides convexus]|uniref:hypothetical protein n=1 Tax=Nocardioides convexus TaxID=2712224 RepID=UPI0024185F68|nr:hypothetical protein [Nocardioides convexus]
MPGLGYLKPDPTQLTRFKAAYVSGPPEAGRRRVDRDGGGKFARHPAVHDLGGADLRRPRARQRRARRRAGDRRVHLAARHRGAADGGPRPGRAPGVAPAARRSRHAQPA